MRRLGGRRTCAENGHVFHVDFNPPEQEGVCDLDGSELIVRDDDKPEVIRHRLEHLPREDRAADRLLRPSEPAARIDGAQPRRRGRESPRPWRRCSSSRRGHLAAGRLACTG
jgi:hypothetical protein